MTNSACNTSGTNECCSSGGLDVLDKMPEGMLLRLRKLIEKEYEYFVLTGSDPGEEGGCCPSDDVGAANALVDAGILDAWQKPMPEGGCTLTVYSFHGEMDTSGAQPAYALNREFRMEVLDYMKHSRVPPPETTDACSGAR